MATLQIPSTIPPDEMADLEAVTRLISEGKSVTDPASLERIYTVRSRPRRAKVRKTYCLSKDWWIHRRAIFFSMSSYNYCWPVMTLNVKGAWLKRQP